MNAPFWFVAGFATCFLLCAGGIALCIKGRAWWRDVRGYDPY